MASLRHRGKALAIEIAGWLLVVIGIAALVLPGPGLLALFAGLALLSQRYDWAKRRVEPVKDAALRSAAQGVQTWPRILASMAGAAWLAGLGVFWGIGSDVPGWWPIADRWWLVGGWATGATLIFSGVVAAAMIVYSIVHFRGRPLDEVEREIAET